MTEPLLTPELYDRLRHLAAAWFRRQPDDHTLQPTGLVHEAWVRLAAHDFRDEQHFAATAARAMRQILVDHARRRGAQRRGGGAQRVTLSGIPADGPGEVDPVALDAALEALADVDPLDARIVELRYFVGLTVPEVARVLDLSTSAIEKRWRRARAWLTVRLTG